MSNPQRRRFYNRRILVDAFQVRIAAVAVLHYMILALLFAAAFFMPAIIMLGSGNVSSPAVQAAGHEFLALHSRLWPPLIAAFVLLVLHNILITHRVAGPLYRLRRYLDGVGGGDLTSPIRFRRKDYLQKEAETASRMVESLRLKISQVETRLDQADKAWIDLKGSLDPEMAADLKQNIKDMDSRIEECMAGIAVFNTGSRRGPAMPSADEPSKEPVELSI